MWLHREKPGFTPKDETLLQLNVFPNLGIDRESPDGKYLLTTVQALMNRPDRPSLARALVNAFKYRITGENLPPEQRPQALTDTHIMHEQRVEYPDVTYTSSYTEVTTTYRDPTRPVGSVLVFERLMDQGPPDRRGQRKIKKSRLVLRHRKSSDGQRINYVYHIKTSADPTICVNRVERFVLMGTNTSLMDQQTEPVQVVSNNPLTWPRLEVEDIE